MYYMGIDCGTQGTKAIVFDADAGRVLAKGYAKHPIIAKDDGTREQKAEWWIAALEEAVKTALEKSGVAGKHIKALAVSGQQHGLVLLDKNGTVLRSVKLWNDTSTEGENAAIVLEAGGLEGVWGLLGTGLPVGFTASKIRYAAEREPDLYAKTAHVLLPHDYINYYLTGVFATDGSEASGTGYYSVTDRAYSPKMLDIIDKSGLLKTAVPPVYPWEKPLGTLLPEAARRLGLSENALVAIGGGDNTMGAVGTSAVIEGRCAMSLGTSGTVCMLTSPTDARVDRLIQVYDILNTKNLVTVCTLNATSATTTVQELFGLSVPELDAAIGLSFAGSAGVRVMPFFNGERMPPLPSAQCVIKHLTTLNCKKEHIARATAEAVIFTLKWGFDKMLETFPAPESLIITGGGGNSAPWRQIAADVFNMRVHCLQSDEGGAFGAAIQAVYAEQLSAGESVTLDDLCRRYIAFDESKTAVPIAANTEIYRGVYASYIDEIKKEWNI